MLASKLFDNEEMNSCYIGVPTKLTQSCSKQFLSNVMHVIHSFFLTFPYNDLREHVLAMWSQCVLILF